MSKINTLYPPWCLSLVAVEIVQFKPILVLPILVLVSHDDDDDAKDEDHDGTWFCR